MTTLTSAPAARARRRDGAPLHIALLTYRGNPHCGGQGVYTRELSRALTELGHRVEVYSGQPYPELCDEVPLHKLPSLDIYNDHFPGRMPGFWEVKTFPDWLEVSTYSLGAFPEPLAFSIRAWQALRNRRGDFDVIHDNQSLGYGLLGMLREGMNVMATIHHPITVDRRLEMAHAEGFTERLSKSRWYSFTRMQTRVAKRLPRILTVSKASEAEIRRGHGVAAGRIGVVPVGVNPDVFRPLTDVRREKDLILTTASADTAMKGLPVLLGALALLRKERDLRLVVIGSLRPDSGAARALVRMNLAGAVKFVRGLSSREVVEFYASAAVAVVPSLYEGFSLPAIEAMSCAAPLVTTTGGALKEVVGPNGEAALLVEPGDAKELADAIAEVLDSEALAGGLGRRGRRRVLEKWSWKRTAERTLDEYWALCDAACARPLSPSLRRFR